MCWCEYTYDPKETKGHLYRIEFPLFPSFFVICIVTFWLALGHYIIRLLVDLKNADRNVQVAVAIVIGLLFLAFAVCHVTSWRGSCCRASDRSRFQWFRTGSCGPKPKPKTTNLANILTQIKRAMTFVGGSSSCGAKREISPCQQRPRYSDCEGRAIFINSRRYAIPTEMKQPPTIVLWLLDRFT